MLGRRAWFLGAFLLAAWTANLLVAGATDARQELYPMTSFPMFGRGVAAVDEAYFFEVQDSAGNEPLRLSATRLMFSNVSLSVTQQGMILDGLRESYRHGCPDHRTHGWEDCSRDPVRPWRLPEDLAATWRSNAEAALGTPPSAIAFLYEPRIWGEQVRGDPVLVFTYHPGDGLAVAPGEAVVAPGG